MKFGIFLFFAISFGILLPLGTDAKSVGPAAGLATLFRATPQMAPTIFGFTSAASGRKAFGVNWARARLGDTLVSSERFLILDRAEADSVLARILEAKIIQNGSKPHGVLPIEFFDDFLVFEQFRGRISLQPVSTLETFDRIMFGRPPPTEALRDSLPPGLVQTVWRRHANRPELWVRIGGKDYPIEGLSRSELSHPMAKDQSPGVLTAVSQGIDLHAMGTRFLVRKLGDSEVIYQNTGRKIRAFRPEVRSPYDPRVRRLTARYADPFRLEKHPLVEPISRDEIISFDALVANDPAIHYPANVSFIAVTQNNGLWLRGWLHTGEREAPFIAGRGEWTKSYGRTPLTTESLEVQKRSVIIGVRFHSSRNQSGNPVIAVDLATPDGLVSRYFNFAERLTPVTGSF